MVNLNVNGQQRAFDGDPSMPLMWYLRDELGLTGTKFGCGVALCGACTVHLNGEAVRACGVRCRTSAASPSSPSRGSTRRASTRCRSRGAISACRNAATASAARSCRPRRCSRQKPAPTDKEITDAMSGNLCRCGCYQRIHAAVRAAARGA